LIPQEKIAMAVRRDVVGQLEAAQEIRNLAAEERSLLKIIKARVLGLVAIQKTRAR
jgi:hypothetical protein